MRIALASDHAGYALKEELKVFLVELGHEVMDHGPRELDPTDDYPDYIFPAANAIARGEAEKGIVIGGSGQGEAMAANRISGVRAAVYYGGGIEILRLSRDHNDANVLALGARMVDTDIAKNAVKVWLGTGFSEDERHIRRIKKLDKSE